MGSYRVESLSALLRALAAVAGAATVTDVASAAVAGALDLTGARAAAVGVRDGDRVRLVASSGYDCDTMSAGAALPIDAALPLTEAVRTRRTVVHGSADAPSWVAVAMPGTTAAGLLVSLAPHAERVDVAALETLGRAAAAAMDRCPVPAPRRGSDDVRPPTWLRVAAVQVPADGPPGDSGDVVVLVPGAGADVSWLVVADICGSGRAAAPTARWFRDAVSAVAAAELTPAELLAAMDRAMRRDGIERFATALAVRMHPERDATVAATVASAGHPPPLVARGGVVRFVEVAGLPLNLVESTAGRYETQLRLEPGELLLAYTDGVVDRGVADRTDLLVEVVSQAVATAEPERVLSGALEAMDRVAGRARDDLAAAAVFVPAPRA